MNPFSTLKKDLGKMVLLLVGLLCLGFLFVSLVRSKGEPRLKLTYLGQITTNGLSALQYRFAITNEGNATANFYHRCFIEMTNSSAMAVGVRGGVHHLQAGMGDVLDISKAPTTNRWRFVCCYAHDDLRSKIYDWQWSAKGPKARLNLLLPKFLRGAPLNVFATSDWIDE